MSEEVRGATPENKPCERCGFWTPDKEHDCYGSGKSGATPATCDRRRHCALCRNLRREHPECGHEYEDTCSYGATPATKADIVDLAAIEQRRAFADRVLAKMGFDRLTETRIVLLDDVPDLINEVKRLRGATPASIPSDLEERLDDASNRRGYYDNVGKWVNDGDLLREASSALRMLRGRDHKCARVDEVLMLERERREKVEAEVTRLREALGRLRTKAIMAGMHFPAEPHFINAGVVCDCEKDLRDEVVAARSLLSVKEGE